MTLSCVLQGLENDTQQRACGFLNMIGLLPRFLSIETGRRVEDILWKSRFLLAVTDIDNLIKDYFWLYLGYKIHDFSSIVLRS